MKFETQGIRIKDRSKNVVSIELNDILKEVYGGGRYFWSIYELQMNVYHGIDFEPLKLEEEVLASQHGKRISWEALSAFGNDVNQFCDLILMGSKNKSPIKWEKQTPDRYESVDVYIEMFDCCYWEVFSKDHDFINRLAHKFKDIELLEPDFLEKKKS